MYDTGSGWLPSDIYTWPDMIEALWRLSMTACDRLCLKAIPCSHLQSMSVHMLVHVHVCLYIYAFSAVCQAADRSTSSLAKVLDLHNLIFSSWSNNREDSHPVLKP